MNRAIIYLEANTDWWRHDPPHFAPCWVCGRVTPWIYLDVGHQHYGCDKLPTPGGELTVIDWYER